MVDTSIQRFLKARARSKEPALPFKWIVKSLPYGLDPAYVEEVQIPWTKLDIKDGLFGAATYSYYPGFSSTDQFNITFYEDSASTVTNWVLAWMRRIKNFEQGWYYLPPNYKENIEVTVLDTRNSPIMEIKMLNVWPIVRDPWALTYSDHTGHLRINQNFSVDSQEIKIISPSGGSSVKYGGGLSTGGTVATDKRGGGFGIFENPYEKIMGQFDPIPYIPKPPVPTIFDKLGTAISETASERAAITKRALKDGVINFDYNDYDLGSSQGRRDAKAGLKDSLKETGTKQGLASAVGMVGSTSRVLVENLTDMELKGASEESLDAQRGRDEGFLSDVVDTVTSATATFTDTVITSAEEADADDLSFPTNMKDAVISTIDGGSAGFQDDMIDPLQDKANDVFLDD
jgi:hypothetical protein